MSRISFEVEPEIHRSVRVAAASRGIMVRQFMLGILQERLKREPNSQDTEEIFRASLPVLERNWDNELDAEYDDLGWLPPG